MSHDSSFHPRRFVLAEFETTDALLDATTKMRKAGHKDIDTHTPYPVHGLEEALGITKIKIPTIVLCGAIAGICAAMSMMYYMNVADFPINVGNRPPFSLPAFIPITFELAILLGGGSSFIGVIALMKLPLHYHPVFESEAFRRATIDRFFLSIEAKDEAEAESVLNEAKAFNPAGIEIVVESER